MLVEEVMDVNVVTLLATSTIAVALQFIKDKRVRNLPVINANKTVLGIISDRDIYDALSSANNMESKNNMLDKEVKSIMSHPVITVNPLDFIEDIAHIFYDEEFASIPVVSDDKLVGIITDKEMLYTLIQLTGIHEQSSHIEIKVPDRPGILPDITSIFGNRKINISSLLIYPYKADPKYKILVFRFQAMNYTNVIKDIRDAGYTLLWPKNDMENRI